MRNEALITSGIVRWARERRGLTQDQLRRKLNVSVEQVAAWESGEAYPQYGKAQDLARALRVPFGFLFLSQPPSDDVPLPDLRTRAGEKPERPSPDLVELLNDVLRRQEWYREFAEENNAPPLAFVHSNQISDGSAAVAQSIRDTLQIDEHLRRSCNSWVSYLTQLTRNAESKGILVMRSGVVKQDTTRQLSVDEFQGFALSDELAPIIFINSRDTKAAQIFTFAHEAAHIWIGESGISNPGYLSEGVASEASVETFCHAVASETLVPKDEFLGAWLRGEPTIQAAEELARHFWVSTMVILRHAYEHQRLNRQQFFALVEEARSRQKPPRREKGGNPYGTIPARNSVKFTDSVLAALRQRLLLYRDASALLGLSQGMLLKLASRRLGAP